MSGGTMETVKRKTSYEKLKSIVDIPDNFFGKEIEITISTVEDDGEVLFDKLRGSIKNIKMSADEAHAERLSKV